MQLAEFESAGGKPLWINPERIISVHPDPKDDSRTGIVLFSGQTPLSVKGAPADVAAKINEALKA
jgi:hypothetical protein